MTQPTRLGTVVSGSLTKGLEVRLAGSTCVEDMAVGRYVTIEGQKQRFFGMITDISLNLANPELAINPPDTEDPFISEVLAGTSTYGMLHVLPLVTLSETAAASEGTQPVKTVPSHFSAVNLAAQMDVERVFGPEDATRFYVGTPLDMETRICLNLEELAKRSNGIFGKSGTGKTYLTRLLLIGMLQKSRAVNLIFDMHSEYGWSGKSESQREVKGLKPLFPNQVAIFALDESKARLAPHKYDATVQIGYEEIEPEDIALLRQTLNLTEPAVEAAYQLARRFRRRWIEACLALNDPEETKTLLDELKIHDSTFQNLLRGLHAIQRLPFLVPQTTANTVRAILQNLTEGINVVLDFGRFTDITAYILVANLLSRRIYNQYRDLTEKAMAENGAYPRPLVITIEEAHKFLNPEVADQTIFGTIAREMRKYNVTLLVIDQRPSGIDEEIMSQLGTKLTCLLDNERDIDSVLAGVSGKNELKSVLSRLESKQQALIFGHAVPMPVVLKVREYGSARSYEEIAAAPGLPKGPAPGKDKEKDIDALWT